MSIRPIWRKITDTDPLASLLLAAFLLRLAILPLFYDDYNYWAFGAFSSFLLGGSNPYHVVTQDPTLLNINPWRYPPLYMLFTVPAAIIHETSGLTILYLAALKLPLAFADTVSAYFLNKILVQFLPPRSALTFTGFFVLNPLVIFESSGGGFNDPIAIAFTVASVFYLIRGRDQVIPKSSDHVKSSILLGLGIATKIYPILLIPAMVREIKSGSTRLAFILFALAPTGLFSAPFLVWDPSSYVGLLTVRSVGGQHPLFPSLAQGVLGTLVLIGLGGLLLLVYAWRSPFEVRLVLTFLWINLAIFSVSFNYMIWGIPFFTLFAAKWRRHILLPLSPLLTLFASFIFEGSYNGLRGAAGLYYWTYHILHQAVVPTLVSPLIGTIGFWLLTASEGIAGYYFTSIIVSRNLGPAKGLFQMPNKRVIWAKLNRSRTLSILTVFVIISWVFVGTHASFLSHKYPTIQGSTFQFSDDFQSSIIDYQWVFPGRGSYTISPSQASVILGSSQNGTGQLFRGWGPVREGFHTSSSAGVGFTFRFDGLSSGSTGMTLANFTDGELEVRTQTARSMAYVDRTGNTTILLGAADSYWHNFTLEYKEDHRILTIDAGKWSLPSATFSQVVLGDSGFRAGFGGIAEFSAIFVHIEDFPTGFQSPFACVFALVLPLAVVLAMSVTLGGFLRRKPSRGLPVQKS